MVYKNKNLLYQKYIIKRLSPIEIAKEFNIGAGTIRYWLQQFNIPLRNRSEAQLNNSKNPDKLNLGSKSAKWKGGISEGYARRIWQEYWREKTPKGYDIHHIDGDKSNNDISNLALLTHSHHYQIHQLKKYANLYHNPKWLYQKYIIEQLSFKEIAYICGCGSHSVIARWLRRFNIPVRTSREGLMIAIAKEEKDG